MSYVLYKSVRGFKNDYCFSLHASQVVCELLFCLFIRQVKYLDGE